MSVYRMRTTLHPIDVKPKLTIQSCQPLLHLPRQSESEILTYNSKNSNSNNVSFTEVVSTTYTLVWITVLIHS